jgi:arylsulfatase A-like enzyme
MSDDHGRAAISSYGSEINKTPNIDRIAAEGVLLTNTMCTNAICTPSRAAILTSQYSHVNDVKTLADELDSSRPMQVQKILKSDGYQTAMIGKWHLGNSEASNPQGFDYWNILPGQGDYYDPTMIEMGEKKVIPGYVTDIITDLAVDWLEQASRDEPFCLMVHHKAPHSPWDPAERHLNLGVEGEFPEPETLLDDYSNRALASKIAGIRLEWLPDRYVKGTPPEGANADEMRRWAYQRYITDYTRTVQSLDDGIGTLLDYLDESGLAENTLVIYTSDQGMFLGEHGYNDKRLMYEESLKMPFVARLPGEIPAGSQSSDILLNVDFAPTLLDYAGIEAPEAMQGSSGREVLKGETPGGWQTSSYYRYWMHMPPRHKIVAHYGVRNDRYKLIYYYGEALGSSGSLDISVSPEWDLYDLEVDPNEMVSVYSDPAYAGVVATLAADIKRTGASVARDGRHKLIYFGDALAEMGARATNFAKEWELFDLEADPKEMNNVFADPAYAEAVIEMTAELDRLQASVGDVGLH